MDRVAAAATTADKVAATTKLILSGSREGSRQLKVAAEKATAEKAAAATDKVATNKVTVGKAAAKAAREEAT